MNSLTPANVFSTGELFSATFPIQKKTPSPQITRHLPSWVCNQDMAVLYYVHEHEDEIDSFSFTYNLLAFIGLFKPYAGDLDLLSEDTPRELISSFTRFISYQLLAQARPLDYKKNCSEHLLQSQMRVFNYSVDLLSKFRAEQYQELKASLTDLSEKIEGVQWLLGLIKNVQSEECRLFLFALLAKFSSEFCTVKPSKDFQEFFHIKVSSKNAQDTLALFSIDQTFEDELTLLEFWYMSYIAFLTKNAHRYWYNAYEILSKQQLKSLNNSQYSRLEKFTLEQNPQIWGEYFLLTLPVSRVEEILLELEDPSKASQMSSVLLQYWESFSKTLPESLLNAFVKYFHHSLQTHRNILKKYPAILRAVPYESRFNYMRELLLETQKEELFTHGRTYWSCFPAINEELRRKDEMELPKGGRVELLKFCQCWIEYDPKSFTQNLQTNLLLDSELIFVQNLLAKTSPKHFAEYYIQYYSSGHSIFVQLHLFNYLSQVYPRRDAPQVSEEIYEDLEESFDLLSQWSEKKLELSPTEEMLQLLQQCIQLHRNAILQNWLQRLYSSIVDYIEPHKQTFFFDRAMLLLHISVKAHYWNYFNVKKEVYNFIEALFTSSYSSSKISPFILSKGIVYAHLSSPIFAQSPGSLIHQGIVALCKWDMQETKWLEYLNYRSFKEQHAKNEFILSCSLFCQCDKSTRQRYMSLVSQYARFHKALPKRALRAQVQTIFRLLVVCKISSEISLEEAPRTFRELLNWLGLHANIHIEHSLLQTLHERYPNLYDELITYLNTQEECIQQQAREIVEKMSSVSWYQWRFTESKAISCHHQYFIEKHGKFWENWKKELHKTIRASGFFGGMIFTSNPEFLWKMGRFVTGSCLDLVSGETKFNRVLPSLVSDPKHKLFVLLDEENKPIARCLITALIDEKRLEPAVIIHKIYPGGKRNSFYEELFLSMIPTFIQKLGLHSFHTTFPHASSYLQDMQQLSCAQISTPYDLLPESDRIISYGRYTIFRSYISHITRSTIHSPLKKEPDLREITEAER